MKQERWTVYEHVDFGVGAGTEDSLEVSWHYSFEKAKQVAEDHANRTGNITRVDLNVGHLNRGSWEVGDSETDLWTVFPKPHAQGGS